MSESSANVHLLLPCKHKNASLKNHECSVPFLRSADPFGAPSQQTPTSAIQPRRLDVDLGTSPVMNPLLAAAQPSPAAQHADSRRPMVPRLKLEHMHFTGIAPEGSEKTGNGKFEAPSADSGFTFSSTTNSQDSFGGSGATAWQWQEVPSPQWLMRSPSY